MWTKDWYMEGKIDKSTVLVGDYAPLSTIDWTRQKISKDIDKLSNTINKQDLIKIYRTFQPVTAEYRHTLFLLHFVDIRFFYKLKVCCNRAWNKSVGAIFPTAFAWFSLSHFSNSCNISNFHYYICYGDLWSVTFTTHWRFTWWLAFFSNKVFLIEVCTFF